MLDVVPRKIKTKSGISVRWYIKGRCPYTREPVRESTFTDSKSEAEFILAQYLTQARKEAALGTDVGTAFFSEAVTEYLGKGGEARFIDPLLDRFGTTRLRDIQDKDLTTLGNEIYPGAKQSTLLRQLYTPMQAVWNKAAEAKMVGPRKFSKPEVQKYKAKPVTEEWLLTLLADGLTNLRQRTAVLFMSFSGARSSEVANVLVKEYEPDRARVLISDTKNDEPREVLLPPFVNEAMKLLDRTDPEAKLFGYASRFSLTRIIKRGCKRAGIKYFSPHKVGRHTFAKRFLDDGNSLKALKEAGGWNDIGVVDKYYGHLEGSHAKQQAASVATKLAHFQLTDDGKEVKQKVIELKPNEKDEEKA